jgi:hypothetical protein
MDSFAAVMAMPSHSSTCMCKLSMLIKGNDPYV